MPRVVPSQVVDYIERAFAEVLHAAGLGRPEPLNVSHATQVAALVGLLDAIPPELVVLQGDDYVAYLAAYHTLETSVRTWELRAATHGVTTVAGLHQQPVALLHRLLKQCPDEVVPATVAGLEFIDDGALRESVRRDVGTAGAAFENGEWKAATVLAGAACEALLLWRVLIASAAEVSAAKERAVSAKVLKPTPSGSPEDWGLHPLIEIAAELGAIAEATRDQLRLAKNFRNLIHPGREQRVGQRCDRATALSALAAMEHTIRDVSAQ